MSAPRRRALYFGSYDAEGGRNAILQAALRAAGWQVETCHVPLWTDTRAKLRAVRAPLPRLALRQARVWFVLLRRHRRASDYDLMIVGSTAHLDLPMARWLSARRGRPLLFDPLVSIGETLRDRGLLAPGSPRLRLVEALERRLFALPDRVLVDTPAHRAAWSRELGLPAARCLLLPAGAPSIFRDSVSPYRAEPPSTGRPLRILYAGQYIPLHGLDTVLEAADRLRHRRDICFELVGQGQELPRIRARTAALELPNLRLIEGWWPAEVLAREHVEGAGICLGIFGPQAKAQRVLPFKVYAALAAGRPVISADHPALRELLHPGVEVHSVPAADPEALARAIEQLADDPAARADLAEAGRRAYDQRFAPEALGRQLAGPLERLLAEHSTRAPYSTAALGLGPRHDWRTDQLVAALEAVDDAAAPLLDAGCGPGTVALKLAATGHRVLAFDRDPQRVALTRRRARELTVDDRVHGFVADAEALPLADGSLAGATAGELMEHVADDRAALRELARVLEPGRRLALTVPAGPGRLDDFDRAVGHHRRYGREMLRDRIESAGFESRRLEAWGWPFGRLYDRLVQRPALRLPDGSRRRMVGRVGALGAVHGIWRRLFAIDERLSGRAGERGSGWLVLAERSMDSESTAEPTWGPNRG